MYPRASSLRLFTLVLAETAIIMISIVAAAALRLGTQEFLDYEPLLPNALLSALVLQLCLYYGDLYEDFAVPGRLELILRLARAFLSGTLVLALVYLGIPDLRVGRGILLIHLPLAFVGLVLWRQLCLLVWGHGALSENLLILGTGPSAQQVAREILRRGSLGFRIAGFLGENAAEVGRPLVNPHVIGTLVDLPRIVDRERISLLVVALEDFRGRLPVPELLQCRLAGIKVEDVTTFFERLTGKILVNNLRPSWFIFSQGFHKPRFFRKTKRILEFSVALAGLVLVSPLLGLLALLIRLESRGPVFYRQERVGEKGRLFMLIKLRTMCADAEAETGPVWARGDGDPRMTRVGRFLRALRFDEIPQLLNVIRAEMSFVGPRPERRHFVDKLRSVIPYYDERHSVKPGITGWAQIRFGYGSNIEDAEEKLQFDLYYIKHMSWMFDVGILFDTMKVMALGRGAR
jgi:sugar transferase (PEP-CTERM system associated)